MSDLEKDVATLEERSKGHGRRLQSLENDRRWVVLTILALVGNALVRFFKSGGQP